MIIKILLLFTLIALPSPLFAGTDDVAIRAGYMPDLYPYEFTNQKGYADGYDVELLKEAAGIMGLDVKFVAGSWNELMGMLKEGEIDVMPAIIYSESRAKEISFSIPHTSLYYSIFVRKGTKGIESLGDLKGLKVVVPENGIMSNIVKSKNIDTELVEVKGDIESLRLLNSGKYDCSLYLNLKGRLQINKENLNKIKVSGEPVFLQKLSFGVKKNNRDLVTKLDEGLILLKTSGKLKDIYHKWFKVVEPLNVSFLSVLKYSAWVIVPLLIVAAIFLIWNRTLKTKVKTRTAEIENQKKRLHNLTMHIQETMERERINISRDVHDALGQLLTAVKVEAELLKKRIPEGNKELSVKIEKIKSLADESIMSIKDIMTKLRPSLLDDLGLEPALGQLARDLEKRGEIKIDSEIDIDDNVISEEIKTAIYRIVQESFTNILKHSGASQVALKIIKNRGNIIIRIKDNGRGITEKEIEKKKSFGLMGIKERIKHYNGEFNINGKPGKGTELYVSIPEEKKGGIYD